MHTRTTSRAPQRTLSLVGAALLIPACLGLPTATSSATTRTTNTTAAASATRATVAQPTVQSVRLLGLDRGVLDAAPAPHHVAAAGVAAPAALEPAVAVSATLDQPAALVAVSAPKAFPAGTEVQVRVTEGGRWSAWTELELDRDHGPDPGSEEARRATRVGSDPLTTADATRVQVRIDSPTGTVPAGTALTAVHAPTSPSDAAITPGRMTASSALGGSAASMPTIITRAQWGADESLRNREPYYTGAIRAGFVHHTASTSSYSPAQAAAQVRAIYAYHTKSLGHSDIDYNFVVDRFGRLYEGRYGGMARAVLGGHTAGFNENTFAVVALGNFQAVSPSASDLAAIKVSIARLFAWKLGLYGVNPSSTARLVSAGFIRATKYPKGSIASIPAVSSHQTVNFTACPGTYLQAQMPAIRALAAKYAKVGISSPTLAASAVTYGERSTVAVSSYTARAVDWTATVLSPCSPIPVRTFKGSRGSAGTIGFSWDLRDASGEPVLPAGYTIALSGKQTDGTVLTAVPATLTITPRAGGSWGPCGNASRVIGGSDAVTSVLWGRSSRPSSRTIVLTGTATASNTARAAGMAAAPLARALDAPLLLTAQATLSSSVAADITARRATEVIIVGSTSVVSTSVARSVAAIGAKVTRLSGATAAGTAAAVAARMGRSSSAVLVEPVSSPAHSHVGSALAASRGVPLLLVTTSSVPAVTRAALAGKTSVTVVAPRSVPDSVLRAGLGRIPFTRVAASDEVGASMAAAPLFPSSTTSLMLMPNVTAAWATASVAASTGVPLVFTTTSELAGSVAKFVGGRPALRGVVTTATRSALGDNVLGQAGRELRGKPWAPVPVRISATTTRTITRANASPEPARVGATLTVRATVRALFIDGSWRAVPDGVAFSVQFRRAGTTSYSTVRTGRTASGNASATVTAHSTGRWRIVVGALKSSSDSVRVAP